MRRVVGKSTTKSMGSSAIHPHSGRGGPLEDLDAGRRRVRLFANDGGDSGIDPPGDDALRLDPEGSRRDAEAARTKLAGDDGVGAEAPRLDDLADLRGREAERLQRARCRG